MKATAIQGVSLTDLRVFTDDRGSFMELYRASEFKNAPRLPQMCQSVSNYGALRGIHVAPFTKVITLARGSIQQIVLDCRPSSRTFGQYAEFELSSHRRQQLIVPPFCGNAFCVTNPRGEAIYTYGFFDEWTPECEVTINPLDPALGINWRAKNPILSDKDRSAQLFSDAYPEYMSAQDP